MADNFKFVQTGSYFTLAGSGAALGATSITLSSFLQIDGTTTLTMTNFGDIGYATIEPGNGTQEEQISFTGITQNANGTATLTGVKTVLFIDPYTQTSGTAKSHPGGAKLVISNTAGFYDELTAKDRDETITGTWTFTNPNVPRMDVAPTYGAGDELKLVTYQQLASTSFAGVVNASTTQKGIVQAPSQSAVDNKSATGSTGALLFVPPDKLRAAKYNDYVVATGTANAIAIAPSPVITNYVAGLEFRFKAIAPNTGATTLAVNGLSAVSIKKNKNINLEAGDITTNFIAAVVYDGTFFQLTNTQPAKVSTNSKELYATSTTGNTAYVVALSPAQTAYTAGMVVNFKPDTGGGHATLNVNGLGAKNIYINRSGVLGAVIAGDIIANQVVQVVYDGTQFQMTSPRSVSTSKAILSRNLVGTGGDSANAGTRYVMFFNNEAPNGTEPAGTIMPFAGTLRNFRIRTGSGNGTGSVTVRVNSSDTSIAISTTFVATTDYSDTTNTASVSAGDRVTIKLIDSDGSNDPTWLSYSLELDPS